MADEQAVVTGESQVNTETAAATETAPATPETQVTPEQTTETQVLQEQANQVETQVTPEPVAFTDFSFPEGITIDPGAMAEFSELAKADGLSQESAQKYVDLQTKLVQGHTDSMVATLEQTSETWKQEVLANDLFKGDAGAENLKVASEAIKKLGGEKFSEYLETTGLGNHPEMVKLGFEISKLINEDTLVNSGSPGGNKSGSFESALYGTK